jgi:hypothetical protein
LATRLTGNAKHISNVDEADIGACSQKALVHMQSGSGIFNMTMQGVAFDSVISLRGWGSAGREGAWE